MRKIFLENLPKKYGIGKDINKLVIDWKKSIGETIKFIYDDIEEEIKITNYIKGNKRYLLYIQYKNNIYSMHTDNIIRCQLGIVIGKVNYKYKYEIGDIVTNIHSGKLKILEQIKQKNSLNSSCKAYRYQCLICGNIDIILENNINNHNGCTVCANKKVKIGYNDIWTTNPNLAKLLLNPQDGYIYMEHSDKKLDWKCINCGNIIKNKKIDYINKKGLACKKCSDGISYPNKLMYSLLEQLNITFKTEYSPDWIRPKKYDFYFELNNRECIIEMDGGFHKKDNKMNGQTKEKSKEIDDYKDKLAKEHEIEVIRIDCDYSELQFIKNNILHSELSKLFKLFNINWLRCHEYACNSLVKVACDYKKNDINMTTKKIGDIMKLSKNTIQKYLKQGERLGWCEYNPKKEKIRITKLATSKKVICLNNNQIFDSLKNASIFANVKSSSSITNCCEHKTEYAGIHLITKNPLHWMYYDEYEQNINNN